MRSPGTPARNASAAKPARLFVPSTNSLFRAPFQHHLQEVLPSPPGPLPGDPSVTGSQGALAYHAQLPTSASPPSLLAVDSKCGSGAAVPASTHLPSSFCLSGLGASSPPGLPTHPTPEGLSAPFSNQSTLLFKHNYAGPTTGLFTTFTNTRGRHNVPNTVQDAVWGTSSARGWDPRSAEPTNREHLRDSPLESDADRGRTGGRVVIGQVPALGKVTEHGKSAR